MKVAISGNQNKLHDYLQVYICRGSSEEIPAWHLHHLALDRERFSFLMERVGANKILIALHVKHGLWNLPVRLCCSSLWPKEHSWMLPLYLGILMVCSWDVHRDIMYCGVEGKWEGSQILPASWIRSCGICHGWRSKVNSLRTTTLLQGK